MARLFLGQKFLKKSVHSRRYGLIFLRIFVQKEQVRVRILLFSASLNYLDVILYSQKSLRINGKNIKNVIKNILLSVDFKTLIEQEYFSINDDDVTRGDDVFEDEVSYTIKLETLSEMINAY